MARKNASSSAATEPVKKQPTGIKYIGHADVKSLMGLEWTSQNDYIVPVSSVDDSLLEYLRSQPDFRVIYD